MSAEVCEEITWRNACSPRTALQKKAVALNKHHWDLTLEEPGRGGTVFCRLKRGTRVLLPCGPMQHEKLGTVVARRRMYYESGTIKKSWYQHGARPPPSPPTV